ncbi:glycosyltransferase [Mycobacterium yunnanensis]|uniref:Glycosyltransferase n=1 Tax=Mycobacterium yunnanensis TaxID=368477 RepID=A0A9X3C1M7_9MYCO|nr:glycosyltransferase [Mycobacterium yunnanensis]MCV7421493.1 glycosyltransferase [Mycobacterium yunnanensis]
MQNSGQSTRTKISVCVFIPDFDYGGAQKQCILLLNELQRRDDVAVTLIRFRKGAQDHLLKTEGLRNEFVDVRSNFDVRAILAVGRLVSASHADIIMSWVRVCDVYSYFVRLGHPRLKWVLTQRNSSHPNNLIFRVRDFLGRRADAIAANSQGGVDWWREKNALGSVHLVDNIAAPPLARSSDRVPRSVLYVGRLEAQKNVLTMIEALLRVVQAQPDVTIWICGDGALRAEMEAIVEGAQVAKNVSFLGFRPNPGEWMAKSTTVVSLSNHEGMPNVLMEAVQAGCRIVASAIAEHTNFLGSDYPFLVRNHHDADAAAQSILDALEADVSPNELDHARGHLARMAPPAVAANYMDIFRDVTARGAAEARGI